MNNNANFNFFVDDLISLSRCHCDQRMYCTFVFTGSAGVLVGHPLDTIKVCHNTYVYSSQEQTRQLMTMDPT